MNFVTKHSFLSFAGNS